MGIWNTTNLSELKPVKDFISEHYQKDRIIVENKLKSISTHKIGYYYSEDTSNIHPNKLNINWLVYDLSNTLSGFLDGGINPTEEKVSSNKKIAKTNDFIISRLRHYLKEMAIVPDLENKVALSTEYLVFRNKREVSNEILLAFSLSDYVQTILLWAQTGNEHPRFPSSTFKEIPLPDILVDNSIYFQNTIKKAIDLRKQSQALYSQATELLEQELGLEQLTFSRTNNYTTSVKDCVNARIIDPKYHHPKFEQIERHLKDSFETIELRKIADIEYGYMPMQDYEKDPNKGIPLIRVTNITDHLEIKLEDLKYIPNWVQIPRKKYVEQGDILMVQLGDTTGKVGYIFEDVKDHLFPSFCLSVKVKDDRINSLFLSALLKSELIQILFDKTVLISTVRPNTTKPRFEKLLIPILDKEFQLKVATLLEKSFLCKKESKQLLEQAKQRVEQLIEEAANK